MLTLAALSRTFGGLKVIEGLDLTIEVGDVLGVIGPNGAGKSTLFNMIAGVLPPSSGRILFDGRDITSMKPWDRSRIGIGRTYQVPKPFTHMSVFENVLVAATHGGRMSLNRARGECDAVLESVGLIRRAETPAGQLALLDMKQLVWVEHVIQTLRRLVTKVVVLHGGGILASGPPEAVIADPRVKDAYLGN
jgi:branched-chain amino acid transport system ATP-binding protein